jgi:LuxR family maltose regulon positive regulatory protein
MRGKGSPPAKIARPVLKGVAPRKRLFRLLNREMEKPLIWISGPAGSGKTTLVGSYLDDQKLPCLWYRLDEGDGDLATFFYYMGLAAQKIAPRKKPLQLLTPEYLLGIPTFTKRFFEGLCGRLRPPYGIVFDNYQDVPVASFHEMIVNAVNTVAKGITVFVISRTEPPQQFARHRANNKMHCFGWDQIRLNLPEAQDVARKIIGNKRLPVEDLTEIYARTSGWVAGLVLLIESLKRGDTYHGVSLKLSRQEIFDYFASEIFDKLDTTLQQFLLRTAFLPKINAAIAGQLTDNQDSERILLNLSQSNYFTEQHLQTDPVYIYHPLFREFLLSRAKREMQASEIRDIQLSAARFLSEDGQIEDAAELFIGAGDIEGLIRLILAEAQGLASQGRFSTLEGWIDKVPPEIHDAGPWLHFWKGICRQTVDLTGSWAHLEKAFRIFVLQGDEIGTSISWSSIVDTIILERNNYSLLDYWVDWMETHIKSNGSFPSPMIEAQVATAMAGAYTWRRPGHPECRTWIERSLELARSVADIGIQMKAFSHALMYFGLMGKLARSLEIINEAAAVTSGTGASPLTSIVIKCYEGVTYLFSAEYYDKALRSIVEGLEIAEKTGVHVLDNYIYSTGIYVYLCIGNMDKARECLKKMHPTVRRDQLTNQAQYHDLAAWLQLPEGNLSLAWHHAEESVSLSAAAGAVFPEFLSRYVAALALRGLGQFDKADEMLSKAAEIARKANSPWCIIQYLFVEAEFAFDSGRESEGLEALSGALAMGREYDFMTIFLLWRTSVLSRLCAKALEAGIENDYVKRFIKKCRLLPDAESIVSDQWPFPIKVYTLGRFGILKDDEPVRFTGKVQQRPLSMLKAFIAFGGRDVHEDRLIDALWPEAEGDVAYISLRTTLHRLRQLLGIDEAVQFSDNRIGLDARYCWVDTWSFLRMAGEAEDLWEKGQCRKDQDADDDYVRDAISVSERAVKLYKGDFLAGDSKHAWAFTMREKLKNKFIRLIGRLGACYEHSAQWDRAIEYYRRAIEVDTLQEEFCQKLMICYQRCGRRSEALAAFRRCRDELSSALGIEPSAETVRIYETLRNKSL